MAAVTLYLFIVSNAHMFDVRDICYDRRVGNTTLPTLIGAEKTRRFLIIANVVGLILIVVAQLGGVVAFHPEVELGMILTIVYVRFLPEESPGLLYGLIIDGCIFILPIAAWIHEIVGGGARL
jgi:4-hydroxybenzoate polyprenyltransferase